ncbi:hypothetical protein [Pseudomonas putida]|uniref:hypothetical protein n=1 Tax=Pseudomonas putida TaxID=303 RepID=UPI00036B505B|nr:hypothetical protein [Pseudomonas putida]
MSDLDLIGDDQFAFFTREELLEQQCSLLENELSEMGAELAASREKIATLVLMWSGVKNELRQAEARLASLKWQRVAGDVSRGAAAATVDGQAD